jgi:hypothetical protein
MNVEDDVDALRALAILAGLPEPGATVYTRVRGRALPGVVMEVNVREMTVRVSWEDGTWSHWFRPWRHAVA